MNNERINIPFTDENSIVLRAIALALLNPEPEMLKRLRAAKAELIGDKVYDLAYAFSLTRFGYSYLSEERRKLSGHCRKDVQNIAARVYNRVFGSEAPVEPAIETVPVSTGIDIEVPDSTDAVPDVCDNNHTEALSHEWLTEVISSAGTFTYSIEGIKPLSGFDLSLVHRPEGSGYLALRVIDANGPKGMSKFVGQFVREMVNLQRHLPDMSRFEVDESGVMLKLSPEWCVDAEFRAKMVSLFETLRPLKLIQKSSSFS
ncbi:hypothetical protein CS022_18145 [Veronia nyctiphanis]|uniref:Uncharacterized protein n=1 Tax=Veronia nyctiphanis TaxID=1278244 RepID=A0A4Q0YMP8_9GAMM|nr:hypothetical protein [Veronia nyctiphanis]RXJ72036.1 hypothetical protein CS022_18050 [Veronia nyctiphanis]RXJ72051.1 hypothetical protein CS022_18145 [Veronia nyctiphanis]